MSEKFKLADCLTIKDGEIKPRTHWRDAQDESTVAPPKMSYLRYETWCKDQGKQPSLDEWLEIHKIGVER